MICSMRLTGLGASSPFRRNLVNSTVSLMIKTAVIQNLKNVNYILIVIFFFYEFACVKKRKDMDEDYGGTNVLYPIILSEVGTFNFPVLVQSIPKNYFSIVLKLVVKYYIPNYHLWRLLGLSKEGLTEYLNKVYDWLNEGSSLIAIHPQTGKVFGFIIGSIMDVSDGSNVQDRLIKYKAKEMQAVIDLYNFMYHSIDFNLVHKTDYIYNIRIWMIVPKVTRKSHIIYELFIALLRYCDMDGIKTVTTIATKGEDKYVAKCFGFQLIKEVDYYEYFKDYNLDEQVLEENFFGYFLSFLVAHARRKQVLTDSQNVCIVLPKLTKQKKKLWEPDYWQQLFWQAIKNDFLTPAAIKKYWPSNILI